MVRIPRSWASVVVLLTSVAASVADEPGVLFVPTEPLPAPPVVSEEFMGYEAMESPSLLGPMLFFTPMNARGEAVIPPEFLPGPADPNDYQVDDLLESSNVRVHGLTRVKGFNAYGAGGLTNTFAESGAQARFGTFYDTGFAGGKAFSPASIAIDGTADAHKRGQLGFNASDSTVVPLKLQLGTQTPSTQIGHIQSHVELLTGTEDDIQVRRAFVRVVAPDAMDALVFGKADPLIGNYSAVPKVMANAVFPIGVVAVRANDAWEGIPQARYAHYFRDLLAAAVLEFSAGIEDQSVLNDFTPPTGGAVLNRYPALASRIRYAPNKYDSYQLGAVARPMGFEDAAFVEHFATGWGASAIARIRLSSAVDNAVYLGVAGGEGMGAYIFNGTPAATTANSQLNTLSNFGAFAAYQHFWANRGRDDNVSSNFMVGFVQGDPAAPDGNETLHQAGVNLIWNVTEQIGMGVEYQYGRRELGSGASGDDHRIMVGLEFTKGKSSTGEAADGSARGAAYTEGGPQPAINKSDLRL